MASRRSVLGLAVALVLSAAGCGPYGALKDTVAGLEPMGAQPVGKCQEFGAYVVDTPGYGCAYFVPGTRRGVSSALASALEGAEFDVACQDDRLTGTIELRARRDGTFVSASVSRRGSVITMSGDQAMNIRPHTRTLNSSYRAAPPGNVIVKLAAHREEGGLTGGTRACREYVGISVD